MSKQMNSQEVSGDDAAVTEAVHEGQDSEKGQANVTTAEGVTGCVMSEGLQMEV
jgi:hypothetical protein